MVSSISTSASAGLYEASRSLTRVAQEAASPGRSLEGMEQRAVTRSLSLTTYRANASILRTADEMLGTLLDIVA